MNVCACDWNHVCARHRNVWPHDPNLSDRDDKELEQERRDRELSRPDFQAPWDQAA